MTAVSVVTISLLSIAMDQPWSTEQTEREGGKRGRKEKEERERTERIEGENISVQ